MPQPGAYAEVLRCLGQFLDGQYARQARVLNAESFVVVAWQAVSGALVHRRYLQDDLAALSRQGQLLRGTTTEQRIRAQLLGTSEPTFAGERSELLRTLGQRLDEYHLMLEELTEGTDGFWVRTSLGVQPQETWYAVAELRRDSQARQARRRA
jgi:hypothetical protein